VATVALTQDLVVSATAARLAAAGAGRAFDGVSTDSRTIAPGALFVALRGERFDGHDFIGAALERGAGGLVIANDAAGHFGDAGKLPPASSVFLVPDTLVALQSLAREVRRQSAARVVAITGSAGKTTTKEVTAELLSAKYHVFRNKGNLNNHIGLPLSLIELRHGPDIAVVELGMNHFGEIRTLVDIAEPDVRVWTNVGDAHVGHFGSREAIAQAKAEILDQARANTLLVANADDSLVMAHASRFAGRIITFGEGAGAGIRASNVIDRGVEGTSADVETPAGLIRLIVPLVGRVQLSNVLAAIAVAVEFGVSPGDIEWQAAALHPVARRGAVTMLANRVRLVDDSYNASPAAMQAMLAALAATPTHGRRVAVLGEMLELGDDARSLHRDCGRAAARAHVDELIVVGGPAAEGLVEGASAEGLTASQIHRYADSASAADNVARLVIAGDLVLVKGSRGTRTDIIADRLARAAEGA
jgi:UDP-N-acetylmuramoyl-tripeptide--D-alanyl-D-alanine ligase